MARFVATLSIETGAVARPASSFRFADAGSLLVESCQEWSRHNAPRLGASLSFYTLLSLTPLLIVIVTIGGYVFNFQAAQREIISQVRGLVGSDGARLIQSVLANSQRNSHGVAATLFSLIVLLFGSSAVLIELQDSLNTMWDLPPLAQTTFQKIMALIRARLFSFALVLSIGFLLLVSLGLHGFLSVLERLFQGVFPVPEPVLYVLSSILSLLAITVVFGAIYKIMPDVQLNWQEVLFGGFVTSILFTLGKLVIGF